MATCGNSPQVALNFISPTEIMIPTSGGKTKLFEFDRVYPPETTQEEVYEVTHHIRLRRIFYYLRSSSLIEGVIVRKSCF